MNEMNVNPSVLIAEKDDVWRLKIREVFDSYGYDTWVVNNGKDALKIVLSLKPDAVIMEMDLPGLRGLDVCRELRQSKHDWTPVIFISEKSEELDAVLGLELGADDYMVKPLRLKELAVRVKSVLRRGRLHNLYSGTSPEAYPEFKHTDLLKNGELILDPNYFTLYKNDVPIDLTRKEFELVHFLLKNKGKAFSRQHIMNILSGPGRDLDERIIDVFISRVRNRIEPNRRNPVYIKTVRNVGYMMKIIPISSKKTKQST